ncbi:hypothetical protein PGTUg99_035726 [Puccinia graminis f. sp. tritici]|uniref:Uncharacterized protein n=1 Tax=Puccinia graminis f. sp. tritici TaxID=56615 RepID=A0A5B0SQW5_PUCGR|nr:hypothetical protein PGTUg99_035726 [Puccinia graminis f. sp. tritici]
MTTADLGSIAEKGGRICTSTRVATAKTEEASASVASDSAVRCTASDCPAVGAAVECAAVDYPARLDIWG